jgi:hypothetical protein
MPIKKTITPAVIDANRKNSQKSTGPRTGSGKQNARMNAFRHGLLAKQFVFHDEEESEEFRDLRVHVFEEFNPEGLLESMLVDEIAVLWKRLQIALRLESKELRKRQEASDVDLSGVLRNYSVKLPIDGSDLSIDKAGWEFERVTVRTHGESQECDKSIRGRVVSNARHPSIPIVTGHTQKDQGKVLEVEAVLGNTLDRLSRYQSALKRDFYRAVDLLRKLQAERTPTRRPRR